MVAYVKVDDADALLVSGRWKLRKAQSGLRYAIRYRKQSGRTVGTLMHRLILGIAGQPTPEVDHRNGDGLDNRRGNLRRVSHSWNMQNRHGPHRNSRSGVRGVYWDRGSWRAEARVEGRKHIIGRFSNLSEAGLAAEAWREEHMPGLVKAA